MNEGKPGTPGASEEPDGDFELARPNSMRSPRTGPDGDYELGRPLSGAPARTDGAPDGGGDADSPARYRAPDTEPAPARRDGTPGGGGDAVSQAWDRSSDTEPASARAEGTPGGGGDAGFAAGDRILGTEPVPARTDGASDGGAGPHSPASDRAPSPGTGDETASGAGALAHGTPADSGAESLADHPAGAADTAPGSGPDAAGTGVEYIADGAAQAAGQPTASAPHAAPTEAPASGAGAAVPGQGAGPAPTVPAPAAEVPAPGVTGTVPAPAGAHGTPLPAAEQPKPLHDPDPYSTPPYGEPGPWAPAPPVQHPAATPAHGVPMGASPVAPEAVAGLGAPPAATAATPAPATPAHGVPMGASAVAPEAAAVPGAPPAAPAATPAHGVPMGASPVAPEAVAGPGASPAAPEAVAGPGAPPAAPAAAPAHGVPMGASTVAPEAVAGPGTPPAAPEPAPAPQDAPAAGPWARYDPWAAPAAVAPLQQADPVEEDVKRRRGRRRRALVGGALVIALVSGVGGGVVGVQLERNGGIGAVELPQAGVEAPDRDPDSVAGIAAQALPSVVTLHVSGGGKAGTGTGFVLDDRGHILTNDHVVEPAGKNGDITVTFHSGDTAEATVVGRDSGYDLAVVRVKGVRGLTPLPLGNSDNVQVGDPVVAIGAPFDLAGTVTSGIISARERPITAGGENGDGSDVSYVDALQTDAPINPGNSGGPLLDGKGRVVGINSAIRSADGGLDPEGGQSGSIGLGFAIPINQGKRVAEELIEHGKATHPVIGITLDMEYGGDGARVAAEGSDGGPPVSTGGPGAKAGIRPGDVITEVDGRPVHSGEELIVKTRAHRPGDRLELTLERNGEERTVSLVLGSSDGD